MLFVGIDWASDHHEILALNEDGRELLKGRIAHSAKGFDHLAEELHKLGTSPEQVAVSIEMHEGPLVLWLLDRGYAVYGINPKVAERARESLSPSGAKDDRRDAYSLAELVRTSMTRLRRLRADDPATGLMRQYVRMRENLIQERTVHKQRLGAHQQQYAPELAELTGLLRTQWSQALLLAFPTMRRLAAGKPSALRSLARKHKMSGATLNSLIELQRQAALPVPEYLDAPHALEVTHWVRAIQELDQSIGELDEKLDDLVNNHPDANLIQSLPSGGSATRGALWSGLAKGILLCRNAEELAARWGVAPVTYQSGKSRGVRQRQACDHTQKQYMLWFSWATSRRADCWASEYYQRKRNEGCGHYSALRAVGRRWTRILWTLFTNKTAYDESMVRRYTHVAA